MADKQIYLHAGAHRTGTSSFQMCLAVNRAALEAAGFDLAYPGRDGIPEGQLGLRLPSLRHGRDKEAFFAAKVAGMLQDHSPDPTRGLILSEENIPGPMIHFDQARFYPAAAARAAALRSGLGPVAHLVYVVRSYGALYVSGHRKRAEDRPVDPFAAKIPVRMRMDRGWPDLIAVMRDVIAPARLTVVEYGARGRSVDLLRLLVPGLEAVALREPEQTLNQSATDSALLALQARYQAGEVLSRAAWQAVVQEHASDTADHGFAQFSAAQSAELQRRYDADLDRLDALDGVTLIRSP